VIAIYDDMPLEDAHLYERGALIEAALATGDFERAEAAIESILDPSTAFRTVGLRALGQLQAARGQWDDAQRSLADSIALGQTQHWQPEVGNTLHTWGALAAQHGDREMAIDKYREALRLFREMGAHAYADRTERALSGLFST
jgi:tetratricopeptide (TPR) repeat protein